MQARLTSSTTQRAHIVQLAFKYGYPVCDTQSPQPVLRCMANDEIATFSTLVSSQPQKG